MNEDKTIQPVDEPEVPLNREQRRAMKKMAQHGKKKPRGFGDKGINTVEVAISRAAKLTHEQQSEIMGRINFCFDAMRKGTWRHPDWNSLADMLNIAAAMASPGFNLLNDHIEKFHAAMDVLAAVAERLKAGKGWTCYAHELQTMETAIEYFCFQVQFASVGEYTRAIEYSHNKISGMRSGSPGKDDLFIIGKPQ